MSEYLLFNNLINVVQTKISTNINTNKQSIIIIIYYLASSITSNQHSHTP